MLFSCDVIGPCLKLPLHLWGRRKLSSFERLRRITVDYSQQPRGIRRMPNLADILGVFAGSQQFRKVRQTRRNRFDYVIWSAMQPTLYRVPCIARYSNSLSRFNLRQSCFCRTSCFCLTYGGESQLKRTTRGKLNERCDVFRPAQ